MIRIPIEEIRWLRFVGMPWDLLKNYDILKSAMDGRKRGASNIE
jgi:hypothetical protein